VNTTASVYLPQRDTSRIFESKRPLSSSKKIDVIVDEN